ncbi:MAG: transcriptional repressor [Rhodospirillales bacterium]|mgnify:CR=1 FL=1|uniref:Ferric uptake regulation protein n=2 Tax=root TaxID=1 RepID=A0A564WAI1_9PROT|nr:transcriptional repressor [Rhodospirillales bacterium]MDG4602506.1 Fur family transcriptional regulator [Defluviicoccus sp.]SUS06112.1 Ferric uptake regulation protein [uncultured Defluviicoccus sp.]VUX45466.1 Ferric uptake regulation protein [Candidatus Defluviicoccus seviourii]MDG4609417.1 Fur family transcriptional regulator [Defluviicoccus sp.]
MATPSRIEELCLEKGMKMTGQRRVIARVLSEAQDHPDVEEVYRRAVQVDPHISIATVYRTVRLLEEANILERHDFGDGRSRYEEASDEHHDHLIDIQSGRVVEFRSPEIEALQREIAERFGFRLMGHRLELFGVPLDRPSKDEG